MTNWLRVVALLSAVHVGCGNGAGPAGDPAAAALPSAGEPERTQPKLQAHAPAAAPEEDDMVDGKDAPGREVATFGAGCFWCVEAVLEQLDGVLDVESGYTGGSVEDPTYEQVCSGRTGHAEAVRVTFDPARISYATLLDWFWRLHDPTTLNRQGADVGTQYRSAIFYHSEEQRRAAEAAKAAADRSGAFVDPIVTEIVPAGPFYAAEEHHQDFFRLNKGHGYCRAVIAPKLDKLGLEK